MLKVCRIFRFEAAHYLPFHEGKCHDLHGHSYKLEVEVYGEAKCDSGAESGMLIDFKHLDEIVTKHVIDKYDHKTLNDLFENPTAEIMVYSIFAELDKPIRKVGLVINRIRLWETENSYAEW